MGPASSPERLAAHCRRTATYCREIAMREGFAAEHVSAVVQAALAFDSPGSADRLVLASRGEQVGELTRIESDLLDILGAAREFDELCHYNSSDTRLKSDLFAELRRNPLDHPSAGIVLADISGTSRQALLALIPRLPVLPSIATRALQLLRDENASVSAIVDLVSVDPVLAGAVIRAANQAGATGRSQPVSSLDRAVRKLGTAATANVVITESLKPLLQTTGHEQVWRHAIDTASLAYGLATGIRGLDPHEAYLVGLVHDAGALLLNLADQASRTLRKRLGAGGSPDFFAELLSYGIHHADAGAEVLNAWAFVPEHVDAVRWHHEPEHSSSRLAALLYVIEVWTSPDEDLPSSDRLQVALQRLGLTLPQLEKLFENQANRPPQHPKWVTEPTS